ncbi:MAG: hypothetical protein ACR2LJ_11825 [Acidimicrobiales bacterium]
MCRSLGPSAREAVAEFLGLAQGNTVSAYQRATRPCPPGGRSGSGSLQAPLRNEVEQWQAERVEIAGR